MKDEDAKVIFISRDIKPDMVYRPIKQYRGGHPLRDEDKIEIAHESLVYEFNIATNSEEFYLISFYTLVQILSSNYRELAISFQIATEQENLLATLPNDTESNHTNDISVTNPEGNVVVEVGPNANEVHPSKAFEKYSETALADSLYDSSDGLSSVNECIDGLKTYNWYKQNPAVEKLSTLSFAKIENSQQNRDSFFVLGRNMLQAADGTAGHAMQFLENLQYSLRNWPQIFQQAFIDGCFYEVFFDSNGKIRSSGFKGLYFQTVLNEVSTMNLPNVFEFINKELETTNDKRFVPKVNSSEKYKFEFEFGEMNEFNSVKIISLKINGRDVSDTFATMIGGTFSYVEEIYDKLSSYYAIPKRVLS